MMASLGGTKLVLCFRTRCERRSLVQVNPRVIAATIAVAIATPLFSLLAAPLLTLVPNGTAHAQEGPSIEIEFDPAGTVPEGTDIDFRLNFSGLSGSNLKYGLNVVGIGNPNGARCESGVAFDDKVSVGTVSSGNATTTGTIPGTCPAGLSILVASLYDSDGDEIISTAKGFTITAVQSLSIRNATTTDGNPPPTFTPAGLWGERVAPPGRSGHSRFHVVDSVAKAVHVYDHGVYNTKQIPGDERTFLTYVKTYDLASTTNPWGIVVEGTTWVSDDHSGSDDKVFAYTRSDERVSNEEFELAEDNTAPRGMHYTGSLLVADDVADKIFAYQRRSGSIPSYTPSGDYPLHDDNADPTGIWASGHIMWVADTEDNKLYAYDMYPTKKHLPERDINGITDNPAGIWSDYTQMYILDSQSDAISGYSLPKRNYSPHVVSGRSYVEYPENSTETVGTYHAEDPEGRTVSWSLYPSGDHQYFDIYGGYLHFKSPPNYEDAKDSDENNVYELILIASSGNFAHTYFPVRVEVTDILGEQPRFADASTTRTVEENTPAGENVGDPVEAINPDDDAIHIYTLGGTDAASFDFSTSIGQIITRAALDYETKDSYSVRVSIRDGENEDQSPSTSTDDSINVTIEVTNVDEGPEVSGPSQVDYDENDTEDVAEFTATNPGNGTLAWSLEGDDAADFTIASTTDGATLRFATTPDYEDPGDDDTDNEYVIKVVAKDGSLRGEHDFTVTVSDVNDAPTFSDGSSTSRDVDEGDQAGREVGAPVQATDQDPGDTLTYSLSGTDAGSFDINSTTGQILTDAVLDFESKQTYSVAVGVRDSRNDEGVADTATDDTIVVTINVQGVNDPPELSGSSTVDYLENGTGPVATYTATDPEGQATITWGLSGSDEDAFSILGGVLSFVTPPDYDDGSTYYFVTIEASDGTSTSTLDVHVYIENVDETPDVTGDASPGFAENGQGEVAIYDDNDPEGGSITWSLSGDAADDMDIANGVLTFNSSPDHEDQETYRIVIRAFDGTSTGTLDVVVTVTDVNEAPSFSDSSTSRTIEENTGPNALVGLPVQAEDPDDGDTLTYSLSGTDADSFTIDSNGQVKTVSNLDQDTKSSYSVRVEVHDSKADDGSVSTTADDFMDVAITVTDVNEPPALTGTTTTEYPENETRDVATYEADDPEGVSPIWSLDGTDKDDFEISGGLLTFKSQPNYEEQALYRVTVQASDGNNTPEVAVTITIIDVNEAPEFPAGETGRRTVVENTVAEQPVGIPVSAEDPDVDAVLTYILSGTDADSFDINSLTGQISTKDALDEDTKATYYVTVNVHDGKAADGSSSTTTDAYQDVTISVTGINEPPIVTGTTTTEYAENGNDAVEIYLYVDPEGEPITWSLSGVDEDDFDITQFGALEFASAPDYETPTDYGTDNIYNVNVLAADGTSTTTYPVTVTVTNVNEDPTFPDTEDDERSVNENTVAGQNIGDRVRATDPDQGDTLTYILGGQDADLFAIATSTGQILTKAELDAEDQATYNLWVYVHDGKDENGDPDTNYDDTINVTITVENVNEPPVVSGITTTEYTENGFVSVATYTAADPELDDITWSPAGDDRNAFTISQLGVLSFVNPPDYEKKKVYSVKVSAADGELNDTLDVTINIADVNEPPDVTGRTTITFVETAPGPVETFKANDPEEGDITWEVLGTDSDDFTIADGALNFALTPDYENPTDDPSPGDNVYEITIKATDDDNHSDTLDVTVIVTDENQMPEFPGATTSRDVSENTASNQSVGSPVRANDPENDYLTYTLSETGANHFDISTSTGQILTKSDLNYEGTKSYTVTVSVTDSKNADGNANPAVDDTIEVTINVIDENEGPEITGATTTSWGENATGTVETFRASDPENATTTWTVDGTDAAHFGIEPRGQLNVNGDLYINTVPDYEDKTFYQVTVRVSDGRNIADLAVTINITNLNEEGVVTLSPSSPEVGTQVDASLTDPDQLVSRTGWTWHRSTDKSNWGSPISGATASAYTPGNADEGSYLRATASYVDGHGAGKTASGVSDNKVPITNSPPSFSPNIVREVPENTGAGQKIGEPVEANDHENDDLIYTLGGADAAHFNISTTTGQLMTKDDLDFETKPSYSVEVSVSDSKDVENNVDNGIDATIPVTVNVKNVNEAPELTGPETVNFDENATDAVETYTATDPENNSISWSVSGTDRNSFDITTGTLIFKSPPNFESQPTYNVTIVATDGPNTDTLAVAVSINNVEEPGKVTLSPANPTVGAQIEATLTDPDGGLDSIVWIWERSDGTSWTHIKTSATSSADSDSYAATSTDEGESLRVRASYTDGQASGKSAQATSASEVGPKPITNTAPEFDDIATTRSVEEKTAADEAVGVPVSATDDDAHDAGKLTYTLEGTDAASFDIASSTGQILTKDTLDRESKDTYTVTVIATDTQGVEDTITVTIEVTDVDEPPVFTRGPEAANYAETDTGPVATYTAVDPEGEQVIWDKSGDDGTHFSVINGVLTFNAQPDHEAKLDEDGNNVYDVTVIAFVMNSAATATLPVKVTVTDVNEPAQFPNGDTGIRSVTENTSAGQNVGAAVAASDPEGDALTYELSGRDASSFDIDASTGQILAKADLNYESKS